MNLTKLAKICKTPPEIVKLGATARPRLRESKAGGEALKASWPHPKYRLIPSKAEMQYDGLWAQGKRDLKTF